MLTSCAHKTLDTTSRKVSNTGVDVKKIIALWKTIPKKPRDYLNLPDKSLKDRGVPCILEGDSKGEKYCLLETKKVKDPSQFLKFNLQISRHQIDVKERVMGPPYTLISDSNEKPNQQEVADINEKEKVNFKDYCKSFYVKETTNSQIQLFSGFTIDHQKMDPQLKDQNQEDNSIGVFALLDSSGNPLCQVKEKKPKKKYKPLPEALYYESRNRTVVNIPDNLQSQIRILRLGFIDYKYTATSNPPVFEFFEESHLGSKNCLHFAKGLMRSNPSIVFAYCTSEITNKPGTIFSAKTTDIIVFAPPALTTLKTNYYSTQPISISLPADKGIFDLKTSL